MVVIDFVIEYSFTLDLRGRVPRKIWRVLRSRRLLTLNLLVIGYSSWVKFLLSLVTGVAGSRELSVLVHGDVLFWGRVSRTPGEGAPPTCEFSDTCRLHS